MSVVESLEHAGHGHPHPHAAGKSPFSKKIGPLSAGAWLGVVVGGVALGLYMKRRADAGSSTAATATAGGATDATATDASSSDPSSSTADPGGLASSGLAAGYTEPTATSTDPTAGTTTIIVVEDGTPAPTHAVAAPSSSHPITLAHKPAAHPVTRRPAAAPHKKPTAPASYTVVHGDTLSSIGARYGKDWHRIFALNEQTINAAARAHGRTSSEGGHWIYPGTVLRLP